MCYARSDAQTEHDTSSGASPVAYESAPEEYESTALTFRVDSFLGVKICAVLVGADKALDTIYQGHGIDRRTDKGRVHP